MRGDVPQSLSKRKANTVFSPHARGCSRLRVRRQLRHHVFPACAGMFLLVACLVSYYDCFPRMRGDVPGSTLHPGRGHLFSPHARGCSDPAVIRLPREIVFPACAGMFRKIHAHPYLRPGFPRMRGDVPSGGRLGGIGMGFSPHARGCSRCSCAAAQP